MKLINNEIECFSVKISSMIRFNRVLHENSILSFIAGVNPLVENHTARGSERARERAKEKERERKRERERERNRYTFDIVGLIIVWGIERERERGK